MTLTTEQAAAMNQAPRLDEAQKSQVIAWFACMSVDEVHAKVLADPGFYDYSRGTVANWQTRFRDQIIAEKRARTVEWDEITFARQEARVDGYATVFREELAAYRAAARQEWVKNPDGRREFVGTVETGRRKKLAVDNMVKVGYQIARLRGELNAVLDVSGPSLSQFGVLVEDEDGNLFGVQQAETP